MKKIIKVLCRLVISILVGYIVGVLVLIPTFFILWLLLDLDAAFHITAFSWCFSGLAVSFLIWDTK